MPVPEPFTEDLIEATKDAVKRNQLRAFRDGWLAGAKTALTLAVGEADPDGGEPFRGEHSDEFLAWAQNALWKIEA